VFSCTLSKTMTVSYSEYARIVSRPITVAGETSKPTMEYTPATNRPSRISVTIAETAMSRSSRILM
jgi:hypothetical protein